MTKLLYKDYILRIQNLIGIGEREADYCGSLYYKRNTIR